LRNGMKSAVRMPLNAAAARVIGSSISPKSGTWAKRSPWSKRRLGWFAPGLKPSRSRSANASECPCTATARKVSPSYSCKLPSATAQRPCAFSRIASNTSARSPGELLMTCSTSALADCCASASPSSAERASSCCCNSAMVRRRSATLSFAATLTRTPRRALFRAPAFAGFLIRPFSDLSRKGFATRLAPHLRDNRPRSCGAAKSSIGPFGTIRVGLIAVMLM